jgi:5-methyltetrahydrofolate--homocysteine methyltransferase
MSRFLKSLNSGWVLLMDGAMGTELRRAGLKEGQCGELWNLTQPEKVRAIHQAYVDAGAEVLLSNTFQANRWALAKHGLENRVQEIVQAGLELARSVAGKQRFVLLDIGDIARTNPPSDTPEPKEQLLPQLGLADAILLETYSDTFIRPMIDGARLMAPWLEGVPVLYSLSYQRLPSGDICTRTKQPPECYGWQVPLNNLAALGANCGRDIGMDEIIEIIRRYRKVTDLPLCARPNAGTPTRVNNQWVYPHTPEKMAARLPELLEAGVAMVGGCCGTTPEHIGAFKPLIDEWNAKKQNQL